MKKIKKILSIVLILAALLAANVEAYQTAPGAAQITFKSGLNLVIDNFNISIWRA